MLSMYLPEVILEILAEIGAIAIVARTDKLHVIGRQRVRNNQMGFAAMLKRPIGQVICIRVGIILKPAFFDYESSRIHVGLSV
jgi:hypothetical protein